jgi:hypothetical protein
VVAQIANAVTVKVRVCPVPLLLGVLALTDQR